MFLADTGLHEDAYDLNRQLVDHLESNGDEPTSIVASILINLANAEVGRGHYEAALETFARARDLVAGELSPSAANVAYNVAVTFAELNQVDEARNAYEEALAIWDAIGASDSDRGYVIRGLAACLARTGRSDEALARFDEAVHLFRQAGESLEVDLTQVGITQARQRRGDQFSATEIAELLAVAERLPPAHRAGLLHNVGNLQANQQDLDGATKTFGDLQRWAAEIGDAVALAKALASQAVVERHRGDLDAAMRLNRDARLRFENLNLTDRVSHAEHNYALLLAEAADITSDPTKAQELLDRAADHAIWALNEFDRHRHALPTPIDRVQLFREVYGATVPATLRICLGAGRLADVAAVVERARIQPVRAATGTGFEEPAPIAAHREAVPVGDGGDPLVLGEIAESMLGPGAIWLGWWTNGRRLVRAWSTSTSAAADQGPLDREALLRYWASLPILTDQDMLAAGDDPNIALIAATWRAASGPMLADPGASQCAASELDAHVRDFVLADSRVKEALESTADELLWPISSLLLSAEVRRHLLEAHRAGGRGRLVVAPTPALGRIPWAALPLTNPETTKPLLLVEAADVVVGLPASLAASHVANETSSTETLILADSLGDLESARRLTSPSASVLGAFAFEPATRHNLKRALARKPRLLAVAGHVRPGTSARPSAAALLLEDDSGTSDALTVEDLAELVVPPWCLILGCDGSGATTGAEWTGVLTGLVWAGAKEVATSTVPVIDDDITTRLEGELLRSVEAKGPVQGLLDWQRELCHRQARVGPEPASAPYRWATYVAARSVQHTPDLQ
ncbi:MAG TPA: tetratricopeptide repeat protein [Mycobacteriales bacterium]|nr:tetratricopeptide repeat protein [Mycobacteriales bacterium]